MMCLPNVRQGRVWVWGSPDRGAAQSGCAAGRAGSPDRACFLVFGSLSIGLLTEPRRIERQPRFHSRENQPREEGGVSEKF
jgi:hypothetical protein